MNFHFVDQILELVPGKKTVGVKHVTPFDFYLTRNHFSNQTALMSSIVGEAVGQLCSWNIIKTFDATRRAVAGIVTEVEIHDLAPIGFSILLEAFIDQVDEQALEWYGQASINGKVILEVKPSIAPLLPMAEFNDLEEVQAHLKIIDRPHSELLSEQGNAQAFQQAIFADRLIDYDRILEVTPQTSLVAQKNISLLAPYFRDHFPKKPVYPVSIHLQSNIQLGQHFLAKVLNLNADEFVATKISRIKVSDFIQPGDQIVTQVTLKEQENDQLILSFRTERHGKRVALCEATFKRHTL